MNMPNLRNHSIETLVLAAMAVTAGAFMFTAIMGVIVLWLPVAFLFAFGLLQVGHRSTRRSW
jgi:hypothetical protein